MTSQQHAIECLQPQRVAALGRLAVACPEGRSRVSRLLQEGAAKIRLPRSAGAPLEAVLINTAGGLTGGDRIDWEVEAGPQTRISITTQACERAYRSGGGNAMVGSRLVLGAGASLAWLPQETILYDRSALTRSLDVEMARDARLLVVEPVILGRTAYGETATLAHFRDRWRVWAGGALVHAEQLALGPAMARQMQRSVFGGGNRAFATMLLIGPDAERLLEPLRDRLGSDGGASHWRIGDTGKLLARLVAADGYALRRRLVPALELLNGQAPLPRLWSS